MQKNCDVSKPTSRVSQIPRARKNRGNSLPRDPVSYGLARSRSPEPKKATGDRQSTTNSLPPTSKSHSSLIVNIQPDSNAFLLDGKDDNPNMHSAVVTKVMRQLSTKKREFMKMKKQLIVQQNALLTYYASLKELETRGGGSTGNSLDDSLGTIRIISVNGWPAHDLMLIIRDDLAKPLNFDIDSVIAPQVFEQLVAQLSAIPDEVVSLGEELIARRLEKVVSQRSIKQRSDWKSNKCVEEEIAEEKLHAKVQAVVQNLHAKILYALQLAKTPWVDRDTLVKKIEKLQKDNSILHYKLDEIKEKEDRNKNNPKPSSQFNQPDITEELHKERAAREALNEVVATAEGMLRVARGRITALERQLKEMKGQLDASHRKQKDLELLYRHRESSYDARSKKLLEVSKTGEITIETLSRQREALELRVKELQEKMRQSEQEHNAQVVELRACIASLQGKVNVQKKGKEITESTVANLEAHIKDLESHLEALRQRSEKLIALEQMHCLEFIPSKETEPKERETELWRELQTTRECLAKTEEELRKSRSDKEEFLTSLSRIAQCGDDASLHDKMASKLIDGEKKIMKLQDTIKELEERIKNMELNKHHYESKLADMRIELKRLRNYDNYGKDIPFQDLQSELLDLHAKVETLTQERNSLASAAVSRALLLERHERSADLFACITRARRDLAAFIEDKPEPPLQDEAARAEVTRSLSSFCSSAAENWSALRLERERVLVLERAVVAQNQHLEREGCVRTHLERRRAALEREVLRGKYKQAACNSLSYCCDARVLSCRR